MGFEFRESVSFWVLFIAAVVFWVVKKSCILKCFIFSTVFFLGPVLFTKCFSIRVLHYYHIMLEFCGMNSVSEVIF